MFCVNKFDIHIFEDIFAGKIPLEDILQLFPALKSWLVICQKKSPNSQGLGGFSNHVKNIQISTKSGAQTELKFISSLPTNLVTQH